MGKCPVSRRQAGQGLDSRKEARHSSHSWCRQPWAAKRRPPRQCLVVLSSNPASATYQLCDPEKSLHISGPVTGKQRGAGLRSQEGGEWGVRRRQKERQTQAETTPGSLPGKPKLELTARPLRNHSTPHSNPASVCHVSICLWISLILIKISIECFPGTVLL